MIDVAVGVVIRDSAILISQRKAGSHQGGLWEFPGGKLEPGETVIAALKRELEEEVAIDVLHAQSLMTIEHDYGDVVVCLHVYIVDEFNGEPKAREGQPLRWVERETLSSYTFPKANEPIVLKLAL